MKIIIKCNNCGKEYGIKEEFVTKSELKMKCRGCGNVIVVPQIKGPSQEKVKASESISGDYNSCAIPKSVVDDNILPDIKSERSGVDEFDLESAPVSVPPPKAKGTIVSRAAPPPPPVGPKKGILDEPFKNYSGLDEKNYTEKETPKLADFDSSLLPGLKTGKESQESDTDIEDPFSNLGEEIPSHEVVQDKLKPELPAVKAGASFNLNIEDNEFASLPVPSRKKPSETEPLNTFKTDELPFYDAKAEKSTPSFSENRFEAKLEKHIDEKQHKTPLPPVLASDGILPQAKKTGDELSETKDFAELPVPKDISKKVYDVPVDKLNELKQDSIKLDEKLLPSIPLDIERSKNHQVEVNKTGGLSYGEIDLGEVPEKLHSSQEIESILPEKKGIPAEEKGDFIRESSVEVDDAGLRHIESRYSSSAVSSATKVEKKVVRRISYAKIVYPVVILILGIAGAWVWKSGGYDVAKRFFYKHLLGKDIDAFFNERDKLILTVGTSLSNDNYFDYIDGINKLRNFMVQYGNDPLLSCYTSYLASLTQLRFGKQEYLDKLSEDLLRQVPGENNFPLTNLLAESAQKLLRKSDVKRVLSLLVSEQKRNPHDKDIVNLTALGFILEGNGKEALKYYTMLSSLENNSRRSRLGIVKSYLLIGDFKTGDEFLSKLLEEFPDFEEARLLKANRYLKLGMTEQAEELISTIDIEKRKKEGPPLLISSLLATKGSIEVINERYYMAKGYLEEILKINPSHVEALLNMAQIDLNEENPVRAMGRYNIVLGVEPENKEALLGQALCYIKLSKFTEAKALLNKLQQQVGDDYRINLYLAKFYENIGDDTEKEKQLNLAFEKNQFAMDTLIEMASHYARTGRVEEAISLLEKAGKNRPKSSKLLVAFSMIYSQLGEYDKALAKLKEAIKIDPWSLQVLFRLGILYYQMQKYADAMEQFEKVYKISPDYPGVIFYRGLVLEASGQIDKALEIYSKAIEEGKEDEKILLKTASYLIEKEQFDNAGKFLNILLEKNPSNADAIYYTGRILFAQKKYADSLNRFEKAIKLNPHNGTYFLWGGLASEVMGNHQQALQYAEKAIERDNNLAQAYLLRGKLRVKMGMMKDGKSDLKKALELNQNLAEAWGAMGIALEAERNFQEALTYYQKYLNKISNDFEIFARAGMILFDMGRRDEAKKYFTKALEISKESEPDSKWRFTSLYYLGKIEEKEGNISSAIKYYQEYIRFAPSSSVDKEEVEERLRILSVK